jgi:SAM-dependent methyltransferase
VNNKCKICGSGKTEKINIGETAFVRCKTCGVHYLADFGEKTEIENYYKKDYIITSSDIIETEFRRLFRATEQLELVAGIMNYKKPPASLLDIGCDKGFFIDQARRFGYDCTGVELSEKAIDYTNNIGLTVVRSLDEADKKFDVAVMWHSLEHFPEPIEFLQQLKKHLSDDAYLFIRVPAFDTWPRKIFGKYWIWLQPENHFFHYTSQSLTELLDRAGYSIEITEHRKPNNRFTKRMYKTSAGFFKFLFGTGFNLRKYLIRKYEDVTGIEIFVVAKIKR